MARSLVGAALCFLAFLEVSVVVDGSFFVSTHQKGRYVKPPANGKRSLAESGFGDQAAFPLMMTKNDNLGSADPSVDQEKRACRLILKSMDLNIDHIMSDADSTQDDTKPFRQAVQYVARNLDLLEKCLARVDKKNRRGSRSGDVYRQTDIQNFSPGPHSPSPETEVELESNDWTHASYDTNRCSAFVCDLTIEDSLVSHIEADSIDLCTLIFVLSAVTVEKMAIGVRNIHKVMKAGGTVVVRDYGLYDYAMIRFEPGKKLGENAYVRQDGTRSYYFSEESIRQLFTCNGFEEKSCAYVCKETVNRKEGLCVPRIFIQGRFMKQ